ncbi:hypothetical protein [Streptomyces sp. NPDC002990]
MNDAVAVAVLQRRRWSWRRRLTVGAVLFVGVGGCLVLVAALLVGYASREAGEREEKCCWEENVTPAWMAEAMGVQVPQTATDRRAGFKTGLQYDVGLLSFTVAAQEADRFLQPLRREGSQMRRNITPKKPGYTSPEGFSHLGLPEPETFVEGMRITSVCGRDAHTPASEALKVCVSVHVHEFKPGTTRVYLGTVNEQSIGKPPPA